MAPAAVAMNGYPQAAAWNIGTTGMRLSDAASGLNAMAEMVCM